MRGSLIAMSVTNSVAKILARLGGAVRTVLTSSETRRMIGKAADAALRSLDSKNEANRIARDGGRPTSSRTSHSSSYARKIVYQPDIDGAADPGEIVWTWVEYEEENGEGKDRPVLVVGRNRQTLLGLMLSSQNRRADDPNWMRLGKGSWDNQGRVSYIRLDRVLEVPEKGIRREGAILDKKRFGQVADRLRKEYGWS